MKIRVSTLGTVCCCLFWFATTCIFAGVFGWAYATKQPTQPHGCEGKQIVFAPADPEKHCLVISDGTVTRLHNDHTKCSDCALTFFNSLPPVSYSRRQLQGTAVVTGVNMIADLERFDVAL